MIGSFARERPNQNRGGKGVKPYFGKIVYGWKMYGLVGKHGKWFMGISIAPKEEQ